MDVVTAGGERARDALRRHATAMTEAILSATEDGAVEAVFAGGSLARGEVAWYPGEPLEIFSDIDLYVVARDEAVDAALAAARSARSLGAPRGVRLLRDMDVGVYTRADLRSQPPRPGTVSLRAHRLVFHGDAADIDAMVGAIGTDVDPGEGLYLLENRVRELGAGPEGAGEAEVRLRRYTLAKTVLDTIVALALTRRTYDPGVDAATLLSRLETGGGLPSDWDGELVAAALGAEADLQGHLGRGDTVISTDRVRCLALGAWRRGAATVFAGAPSDWATLILRRCRAGDYKGNLREFLAMSAGLGRAKLRMAWTGAGLARYSAVNALRLGAIVDAILTGGLVDDIGLRSLDGLRAYLDRLTDVFGFRDGPLEVRVATMHRAIQGG